MVLFQNTSTVVLLVLFFSLEDVFLFFNYFAQLGDNGLFR